VTITKSGCLGTPEGMMGHKPHYIYYDSLTDVFFVSPQQLQTLPLSTLPIEYITTIYPRTAEHETELLEEVEAFHREYNSSIYDRRVTTLLSKPHQPD
jgi:hypothetical protein